MSVAVVVLAAGASRRLGEPKQLVHIEGEMLLARAVRIALEVDLGPVIVVLGAGAGRIVQACDLRRAWVVVNSRWSEGMGSSVRVGVELVAGMPEVSGVVIMTCDMPGVQAEHLQALVGVGVGVVGSEYGGRVGVPAYFPREMFGHLLASKRDAGARELLRGAQTVPLPGGEADIDTLEDLMRVRRGSMIDERRV